MGRRIFPVFFAVLVVITLPSQSRASSNGDSFSASTWTLAGTMPIEGDAAATRAERTWRVTFAAPERPALAMPELAAEAGQPRTQAVQYSDAYNTRRKIHMYASFATAPLFILQYMSGQNLYDGKGGALADAHGALAGSVAGLFAVNSVTGVWNLWEGRNDSNGRTRRLLHSLLMLGADAGFVATGMMAPEDDDEGGGSGSRSTHRTVAITSMGIAAAGYVYALVTR